MSPGIRAAAVSDLVYPAGVKKLANRIFSNCLVGSCELFRSFDISRSFAYNSPMSGSQDERSRWRYGPFRTWHSTPRSKNQVSKKVPTGARALGYTDVGLFFLSVVLLAFVLRVAIRIGLLPMWVLSLPSLPLQITISLFLVFALYFIVRLLHGTPVWSLLGWRQPDRQIGIIAVLGGASLALVVDVIAHATTSGVNTIHVPDLVLLDVILGPFVEESFFRGCLQPVVARGAGETLGIVTAAIVFASLHSLTTVITWLCFTGTGMAYGYIRAKSNSTAAAAYMHAAYNAALFFCQFR